jgi:hypothetical protein
VIAEIGLVVDGVVAGKEQIGPVGLADPGETAVGIGHPARGVVHRRRHLGRAVAATGAKSV